MRRSLFLWALTALLTPVTAHAQDISLWPLFVLHRDEERLEVEALWPAFQMEREADEAAVHVLWPLTGFVRSDDQRHRWIFPLLFWGRTAIDRRYGVLFPIAGSLPDRGVQWILNFYHREDGDNHLWALWPLWFERSPGQWSMGIPPFAWNVVDGRLESASAMPLAWWSGRDHWGLFPLIWRDGDWWASFPLFGRHFENPGAWFFLFPLFVHTVDATMETDHVLWPFLALGVETYGMRGRVWPLFGFHRQIWAHGLGPRRSTTYWLWPLGWRHRIWHRSGDLMRSHFVMAPLLFSISHRFRDDMVWRHTVTIPPLITWWHRRGEDLTQLAAGFPLYYQTWDDEGETTWRILWEAVRGQRAEDRASLRVLWRLFRFNRRGERTSGEVFPLFFWSRDRAEDRAEVSFLWWFAQYTRDGDERGLRLLFVPWAIPLS